MELDADSQQLILPGCAAEVPTDWLTKRMHTSDGGWQFRHKNEVVAAPSGLLDDAFISLIKKVLPTRRRLAIAVSRVQPGIVLGPAIQLALTCLVIKSGREGAADQTVPFPLLCGERIVIASRSHAVRDLLAESIISFERQTTRVCQFPTFRVKRTGDLEPGFFGRLDRKHRPNVFDDSPQFVLYDYSPLPAGARVGRCRVMLAELAEVDTPETTSRMLSFADASSAQFIITLVSYYDTTKIAQLRTNGFHVVAVRSLGGEGSVSYPTLSAVDAATPLRPKVSLELIDTSSSAAISLARAYVQLAGLRKALNDEEPPRVVRSAWGILGALATAPAPIQRLEIARRRHPGMTTLNHALERLQLPFLGDASGRARGVTLLRWPEVMRCLTAAYDGGRQRDAGADSAHCSVRR